MQDHQFTPISPLKQKIYEFTLLPKGKKPSLKITPSSQSPTNSIQGGSLYNTRFYYTRAKSSHNQSTFIETDSMHLSPVNRNTERISIASDSENKNRTIEPVLTKEQKDKDLGFNSQCFESDQEKYSKTLTNRENDEKIEGKWKELKTEEEKNTIEKSIEKTEKTNKQNLSIQKQEQEESEFCQKLELFTLQEGTFFRPAIPHKKLYEEPKFILSLERKKARIIAGIREEQVEMIKQSRLGLLGSKVKPTFIYKKKMLEKNSPTMKEPSHSVSNGSPQNSSLRVSETKKNKIPNMNFSLNYLQDKKKQLKSLSPDPRGRISTTASARFATPTRNKGSNSPYIYGMIGEGKNSRPGTSRTYQ